MLQPHPDIRYEVHYTEPDGTRESDTWSMPEMAAHWADWCRADGCTDVEIVPVVDGRVHARSSERS